MLNILQVQRIVNEKKQKTHEAYEKVLSICQKRIKDAAEGQRTKTFMVVPEFIVGYPIFDMNMCLDYVVKTLKKNGFLVEYIFPKMLYVSWDLDEIKTKKIPIPLSLPNTNPKTLLTSSIVTNKKGKISLNF
jgi:hypothetical protein